MLTLIITDVYRGRAEGCSGEEEDERGGGEAGEREKKAGGRGGLYPSWRQRPTPPLARPKRACSDRFAPTVLKDLLCICERE